MAWSRRVQQWSRALIGFPVRPALAGLALLTLQACAGQPETPLEPVDWNAPLAGRSIDEILAAPERGIDAAKQPVLMARERVGVRVVDVRGPGTWRTTLDHVHRLSRAERLDDAEVARAIEARAAELPAPYLFELARRVVEEDPQRGLYWYALGQARTVYAGARCTDPSVQANIQATLIDLKPVSEKARVETFDNERLYARILQQVRDQGPITDTTASPWWICSSGQRTLNAARRGGTLAKGDWLLPRADWPVARKAARDHLDAEIARALRAAAQ